MEEEVVKEEERLTLLEKERTEIHDLMASYNIKILEPLRVRYNRRQRHNNRLEQLVVQYRIDERGGDFVTVEFYLTTHDKLLMRYFTKVKDSAAFDMSNLRHDLQAFMIDLMRSGLAYVIRGANKLPEELI
jgi:hypothetical protein